MDNGTLCLTGGTYRDLFRYVIGQTHKISANCKFPDGLYYLWNKELADVIENAGRISKKDRDRLDDKIARHSEIFPQAALLLLTYIAKLQPRNLVILDSNIRRGALRIAGLG